MSYENTVQQLLTGDGHEILATIVEWDETSQFVKVNKVLAMIPYDLGIEEDTDGKSFYILKPWVSYTNDLDRVTLLSRSGIVAMTEPSPIVKEQYGSSISEIADTMTTEDETIEKPPTSNVFSFNPKQTPPTLLTE